MSLVQNCQVKMFKAYACLKNKDILIQLLQKCVFEGPINNKSELLSTMTFLMQFVVNLVNGPLDKGKPYYLSPLGQHDRHFADDVFKCIFVNGKFCILIRISLKFVPKGAIDNNPALVQRMPWRRTGDRSLSEPMLIQFIDAYMRH